MSTYSVQALQEKLSRLSLSQDSIETLSLWIIHHKSHAKISIETWLDEIKKASADKRLVLFYLANDILQNGRRRGADIFLETFQDPLRQAVIMIGGQKIQTSIERMFRIWKERRLYSNAFLKELEMLIEPVRKPQVNEPVPDFKVNLLEDALSEFAKFEAELKVKSSHLSHLRVDISNPTASLSMLKDKSAGGRVSSEFEEASQKLQDFCECLGIEVNERINILDTLKECKIFSAYRFSELRRTTADYKTLSSSVKDIQKKLDQRLKDLERAHSTATSDPSAKEDITDVGDMEIESDAEGDDNLSKTVTSSEPSLRNAPGMMTDLPSQQAKSPPSRSGYMNVQLPQYPGMIPRVRPPPRGPGQFQRDPNRPVQPFYNPRPAGPMIPRQPRLMNQEQHPPLNSPRSNFLPSSSRNISPVGARPFLRGPVRMPLSQVNSSPHVITGSPVSYRTHPSIEPTTTIATTITSTSGDSARGDGPEADTKPSLDQRLRHLVANNRFENTLLGGEDASFVEDKPYSPSAGESLVVNNVTGSEEDKESLPTPTPSLDSPNEISSPNMDNPILQALYKSQASPEVTSATTTTTTATVPPATTKSLVPDYDQDEENDELTTVDLKNILNRLDSEEAVENNMVPTSGGDGNAVSIHTDDSDPSSSGGDLPITIVRNTLPNEIKITPTLTNLLDEIFPQLSKSLIDRKRKQTDARDATKVPRLIDAPPPRLPQQRPPLLPRSPGGGFPSRPPGGGVPLWPPGSVPAGGIPPGSVPLRLPGDVLSHTPAGVPPRPPGDVLPRPPFEGLQAMQYLPTQLNQTAHPYMYNGPRSQGKQMIDDRFQPSGHFSVGMQPPPRMRTYVEPGLYRVCPPPPPPPPRGYRPGYRPRYVSN